MKKIFLFTIISFFLIQSANADIFKMSDLKVEYNNVIEESTKSGDMKLYYQADELVLSTMDYDKDGKTDSWSEYKDGLNISSMLDSNENNKPDYFVEFDSNGNITKEVQKKPILETLKTKIIENKWIIGETILVLLLFVYIRQRRKKKHSKIKKQ